MPYSDIVTAWGLLQPSARRASTVLDKLETFLLYTHRCVDASDLMHVFPSVLVVGTQYLWLLFAVSCPVGAAQYVSQGVYWVGIGAGDGPSSRASSTRRTDRPS
jgi:hypothetical protein